MMTIKINRIHTEVETQNILDKEYNDYNSVNRRSFYFNDLVMANFREKMNELREKEAVEELKHIVRYGYISQHWR